MRRVLIVLLLVAACEEPPETEFSQGPVVVEASPPYPQWSIAAEPTMRLGSVEGSPESQFSGIVHAGLTTDGRLVVVDGSSMEVRWFGADGDFQLGAGGRGEGPGQFSRIIAAASTPHDTVVIYDARTQRLTWFGPDGELAETRPLELQGNVTLVPLPDARLLVAEERAVPNLGGEEYNATRDSVALMITGRDEQAVEPLFGSLGRQAVTWVRYSDGSPTATQQMELPFGHATLVGATHDHVAVVQPGDDALGLYDRGGQIVRLARRPDATSNPVTRALQEAYLTNRVETAVARGMPDHLARANAEALLDLVPEDQQVAPFDRMLSDPLSGHLWVRDTRFQWETQQSRQWTVYDEDGALLARVATPAGLDITQVGPGHVVGVERDELGVEHVAVYQIENR